MQGAIRILLAVLGGLALFVAINIWLDPARVAAQLGVTPVGDLGLSTIRGDLGGFFAGFGIFALASAAFNSSRWLLVPMALIGLALAGRVFSVLMGGATDTTMQPMVVEAVLLAVLVVARAVLSR